MRTSKIILLLTILVFFMLIIGISRTLNDRQKKIFTNYSINIDSYKIDSISEVLIDTLVLESPIPINFISHYKPQSTIIQRPDSINLNYSISGKTCIIQLTGYENNKIVDYRLLFNAGKIKIPNCFLYINHVKSIIIKGNTSIAITNPPDTLNIESYGMGHCRIQPNNTKAYINAKTFEASQLTVFAANSVNVDAYGISAITLFKINELSGTISPTARYSINEYKSLHIKSFKINNRYEEYQNN